MLKQQPAVPQNAAILSKINRNRYCNWLLTVTKHNLEKNK